MRDQTRAHLKGVAQPLAATPNVTDDDVAVRKAGALPKIVPRGVV
jgi:hypothetical protein